MDALEFQKLSSDRSLRAANYQEMVRAYYNLVTDTYRRDWGDSFHFAVFSGSETLQEAILANERAIADEGGFRPEMNVLDVGCGVGGPALNIAAYSGAHVTGINIVEGQLEIARKNGAQRGLEGQTEFMLADAMNMPFADESFDRIYSFDAICHLPDKAAFYQECFRVLRPGGVFLGQDWMRQEGLAAEEEQKYIEPICKFYAVPHLVTLGELRDYLVDAGFVLEALDNLADRGNILRNWELLDNKILKNIHGLLPWLIPPVLRLLTDGGYAMLDGARSGAFVLGRWRACKPNAMQEAA